MYVCMHACMHAYMHVCICVSMYVFICNSSAVGGAVSNHLMKTVCELRLSLWLGVAMPSLETWHMLVALNMSYGSYCAPSLSFFLCLSPSLSLCLSLSLSLSLSLLLESMNMCLAY